MGHCFGMIATLGVCNCEHVQRVVVVGVLIADETQLGDRFVVLAAVYRQGRRVQTFFDRAGQRRLWCGVAFADVQVQADALVKFLLVFCNLLQW